MENFKEDIEDSEESSVENLSDDEKEKASQNGIAKSNTKEVTKTHEDVASHDSDSVSLTKIPRVRRNEDRKNFENSVEDDEPIDADRINLDFENDRFFNSLQEFKRALIKDQKQKLRPIVSEWFENDDWNTQSILFIYLSINYQDKDIFRYIMRNINENTLNDIDYDLSLVLRHNDGYELLSEQNTRQRFILNNRAFSISVFLNVSFLSEQILTNSQIILSTQLMLKMIQHDQRDLIKYCLKYRAEYDKEIKNSRILLSGAHLEQSLSNKILLSDFFNLMLEKNYSFAQISQQMIYLKHYINYRELFVLFAARRKVRLLSFLINSSELNFKFEGYMIIDVMANDVYDIAMLLYREYFLKISENSYDKIIKYLTTSFMKTGQTEEK